jgi:Kef-type K+ transport system membrane component KefB/Trk K+ transport system NAD-binding subunit
MFLNGLSHIPIMIGDIFTQLSIVLVIATIFAGIAKVLKQPLIISYIATGIVVSPYFLNIVGYESSVTILSEIGVALLLFLVGISLSPKVVKEVGKVALVTGVGQVMFTSVIGYIIITQLGFAPVEAVYLAIALAFSSTIIIMKLLADRGDLDTLYGKIAIGFLLVQDLIAVFILLGVTAFSGGLGLEAMAQDMIFNGLILLGLLGFVGIFVLPKAGKFIASSQEFLYLFSISWCMAFAALFNYFSFSIEVGALVAGVMLSLSPYHEEIASKVKPLKDFFIILFFIFLGSQMQFESVSVYLWPAVLLSIFVLVGNPLILMTLMGMMGYSRRNGFFAGLTVAQISEFSLILVGLGVKVGHIGNNILSLATIVGIITITCSSYLILYAHKIYPYLSNVLKIFERKDVRIERKKKEKRYEVIMFGHDGVGYDIMKSLKKMKKQVLIVDCNPATVSNLSSRGYNCKYGDATDMELLNGLDFKGAKMVISTVPDFDTNIGILHKVRSLNKKTIVISVAHGEKNAINLYKKGVSYVITPYLIGGHHTGGLIEKFKFNHIRFKKEQKKHILHLKNRMKKKL